jgi:hypothetical protein
VLKLIVDLDINDEGLAVVAWLEACAGDKRCSMNHKYVAGKHIQ